MIEEAIKSASPKKPALEVTPHILAGPISNSTRSNQPPPRQHIDTRQPNSRRPSQTSAISPSGVSAPPLVQAESWRSKAGPLPPPSPQNRRPSTSGKHPNVPQIPQSPSFNPLPPRPTDVLEVQVNEVLEVVDFSDLGSYVGVVPETPSRQNKRPVASDFFEDAQETSRPEIVSTWRRTSTAESSEGPLQAGPRFGKGHSRQTSAGTTSEAQHGSGVDSSAVNSAASHPPPSPRTSRASAASSYREAKMSALDDVMSRIKGAITVMHETPSETQPSTSTVPPIAAIQTHTKPQKLPESKRVASATRAPQPFDFDSVPQEVFDVTGYAPPKSPKPAWNAFVVRLSKVSLPRDLVTHGQLRLFNKSSEHRWDILSFNPPLYDMRREFDLNSVFPQFQKPSPMYKGKHKYRVALPNAKSRSLEPRVTGPTAYSGARVNLPVHVASQKPNSSTGAFGRPTASDGLSTWRKAPSPSTIKEATDTSAIDTGLATVSRSPPPQPSPPTTVDITKTVDSDLLASAKEDSLMNQRPRSQPKMPAGSAVAVFRNSRVATVDSTQETLVNFIVGSELDESSESSAKAAPSKQTGQTKTSKVLNDLSAEDSVLSDFKSQPSSPEFVVPSLALSKGDSSDDSVSP